MTTHWLEVTKALHAAINPIVACERRYVAYFEKEDVVDGRYLIVAAESEHQEKRSVAHEQVEVDVLYQRALPAPTPEYKEPKHNVPWLDEQAGKLSAITDLFQPPNEVRPEGVLRGQKFAGASFLSWSNSPIYRPDMLRDYSIFTAVARFTFRVED